MTQPANRRQQEATDQRNTLAELPPHLVQQFSQMALMLPETESGLTGILELILNATDVHDLDKAWDGTSAESLLGKWIVIQSATRSVSDFSQSLGIFLVVKAYVEDSKSDVTFTVGSMAVVAQVVKAYAQDALPLRCKLMTSDSPTKDGFWPMHLEIHQNQPGK